MQHLINENTKVDSDIIFNLIIESLKQTLNMSTRVLTKKVTTYCMAQNNSQIYLLQIFSGCPQTNQPTKTISPDRHFHGAPGAIGPVVWFVRGAEKKIKSGEKCQNKGILTSKLTYSSTQRAVLTSNRLPNVGGILCTSWESNLGLGGPVQGC